MLIQKTVYIREEDIELWNKLSNKAAWIHDCLSNLETRELSTGAKVAGTKEMLDKVVPMIEDNLKFNSENKHLFKKDGSPKSFEDMKKADLNKFGKIEEVKQEVAKIKPLVELLGQCSRHHVDRSICKCS